MRILKIENAKVRLENRFYTIKELEDIVESLKKLGEGVKKQTRKKAAEHYELFGV